MVIKKEYWQCEYCKKLYWSDERAKKCEKDCKFRKEVADMPET